MSKFMQLSKHIVNQRNQLQLYLTTTTGNGQAKTITSAIPCFREWSSSSSVPPPPEDSDPKNTEPFIPPYQQKIGEPVQVLRARLLYQSRKRGMLENGLLLSTFAAQHLDSMTEPELKDYDRIINLPSNDWDIYYWATGVKPIPLDFDTPIMHKFIDHVRNSKKETRFQQPDLY